MKQTKVIFLGFGLILAIVSGVLWRQNAELWRMHNNSE